MFGGKKGGKAVLFLMALLLGGGPVVDSRAQFDDAVWGTICPDACPDAIRAEELSARGHEFLQRRDFRQAIAQFETGLEVIGDRYYTPDILDDTDQKLTLAGMFIEQGDFEAAAGIKQSMLNIRIKHFKEKYECE